MISKEQLLKAALAESAVEIPGRGTVRVRSLTRAEALRVSSADAYDAEVIALTGGLVDPALTAEEVRQLLDATGADELQPVVDEIMRLSGMGEGAQKSSRTSPDDGGDGPTRVRAGEGPGDDPG